MNSRALQLIDKFYDDGPLRDILLRHSISVTQKALRICYAHPELNLDVQFVEEAAMLHDIGIIRCDAPKIECHGSEPYIRHGIMGAAMLRDEGLPRHARVCERHTGAGISAEDVVAQGLPLPVQSYLPETLEEQLVCYADKFFSKTKLKKEKTIEQAEHSISKFGEAGLLRFRRWEEIFEY